MSTSNEISLIAKRIASLKIALVTHTTVAQEDRNSLAAELTSGLLVNSVRLTGWAQRLAQHETNIAAIERAIQELSLIECILE